MTMRLAKNKWETKAVSIKQKIDKLHYIAFYFVKYDVKSVKMQVIEEKTF